MHNDLTYSFIATLVEIVTGTMDMAKAVTMILLSSNSITNKVMLVDTTIETMVDIMMHTNTNNSNSNNTIHINSNSNSNSTMDMVVVVVVVNTMLMHSNSIIKVVDTEEDLPVVVDIEEIIEEDHLVADIEEEDQQDLVVDIVVATMEDIMVDVVNPSLTSSTFCKQKIQ